jgi:2-iminobutanoate/2-iminopropanoate deaminase
MKQAVLSKDAAAPIGPYSQAVRAGDWLYVSGCLGLDPTTGYLVHGGVTDQARQALTNLSAVLAAAGATATQVVKTTVFLTDMNDFNAVNGLYATLFDGVAPARSVVEVARLPKDAMVGIEAVAFLG